MQSSIILNGFRNRNRNGEGYIKNGMKNYEVLIPAEVNTILHDIFGWARQRGIMQFDFQCCFSKRKCRRCNISIENHNNKYDTCWEERQLTLIFFVLHFLLDLLITIFDIFTLDLDFSNYLGRKVSKLSNSIRNCNCVATTKPDRRTESIESGSKFGGVLTYIRILHWSWITFMDGRYQ